MLRFETVDGGIRPLATKDLEHAKKVVNNYLREETALRATIYEDIDGELVALAKYKMIGYDWKWIDIKQTAKPR